MNIERRMEIEKIIREALVDALLEKGYGLSVYNGGDDDEISNSRDASAVKAVMGATDSEWIYCYAANGNQIGCVFLVYGNDGWDVIADYTVNLEIVVDGLQEMIDKFEEEVTT